MGEGASPLVSIVIPVFNRADIIKRTIESCFAQSYPHFEIVVIDDCSTDDLTTAVSPFVADPRFRLIRQDRNRGVSAARNHGIQQARGALVAFLDSDDSWYPAKLEKQIQLIAKHRGDRFLCGTMSHVTSDTAPTRAMPKWRKPKDIPMGDYMFVHKVQRRLPVIGYDQAPLVNGYFAHTSTMLLPRPLALETPFRTALNQYEDIAFLLDLSRKNVDFLLVEEPLAVKHDDYRPGRLGDRDDIERGHRFLAEIGDTLSLDAKKAFEVSHLAHLYGKDRPLKLARMVLHAFARGLIGHRSVLGIFFRSFFGQSSHKAVRDALGRLGLRSKSESREINAG